MAEPRFPYVMVHEDCGAPAFFLRREIKSGDLLLSADAALLDGSPMPAASIPTCGSCGKRAWPKITCIGPVA